MAAVSAEPPPAAREQQQQQLKRKRSSFEDAVSDASEPSNAAASEPLDSQ
jgi:hypothetical protein